MKFEHKHERIIPFRYFILRLLRYAIFAFALIIISVGMGMLGYHHYGKLSWLDSFHMACMILTGMGPVVNLETPDAKIFSSLYALYSGIAFLTITAVFFTPIMHRLLHILQVEPEKN